MEIFWPISLLVVTAVAVAGFVLWRRQNQQAAAGLRKERDREQRLTEMPVKTPPD